MIDGLLFKALVFGVFAWTDFAIISLTLFFQDDHGYVSREFHRRYRLPSSVEKSAITCSLSTDGLLTLTGPKITGGSESGRSERSIPVSRDDKPNAAASS